MMPASSANVRYALALGRLVPRGREQVGLADAVAAVEVARGRAALPRSGLRHRFGLGACPIAE